MHDDAHATADYLKSWHVDSIAVMPFALFGLLLTAASIDPESLPAFFAAFTILSPIWLPVGLFFAFWLTWMHYIRYMFWFSQDMVLVEIFLPPEVTKSPLAMELFLTGLWNSGGEATFISRIWEGKFRPIWSLEIASNEGRISYYIHMRRAWKNTVEARLYGQFPEARVVEVDDYVTKVPFNLEEYELWGGEYSKSGIDMLPIKTYVDYQLDKNTDTPEVKIDPITNLLEFFGTVGKDQYLWIQIIMKARKKDEWYGFYKGDHMKDDANKKIREIMAGAAKRANLVLKESDVVEGKVNALLTDGEKKIVEAIERSMAKPMFDCGMRFITMAKKEVFNGTTIGSGIQIFNPYYSPSLNKINITAGLSIMDYPWQDLFDIRRRAIQKNLHFFYKHRAYFYVPYDQVEFGLTTEELATLWHFPGSDVKTPSLQRVPAKVSDAPINLPTN